MKTLLLIVIIAALANFTHAQNSNNTNQIYEIQCTMSVDDILHAQPWDIDHAPSEFANNITMTLFEELEIIYEMVNNQQTENLDSHIEAVDSAVESAIALGMNYSMFTADLDFIETLN